MLARSQDSGDGAFICTLEMFHTSLTLLLPGSLWRRVNLRQSTFFIRSSDKLFVALYCDLLSVSRRQISRLARNTRQTDTLVWTVDGAGGNIYFVNFWQEIESGCLENHFTFLAMT